MREAVGVGEGANGVPCLRQPLRAPSPPGSAITQPVGRAGVMSTFSA